MVDLAYTDTKARVNLAGCKGGMLNIEQAVLCTTERSQS